ncbi:MAG: rRNA maturation RNase YbeY [Myxococcaceae bacterium]
MSFGIHVSGQELLPKDKRALILRKIKQIAVKAEVSVLFVADKEIKALNKKWRGKNKPTDVLSFPAEIEGILGDIVISVETAARQALEWGHDFSEEIWVLLIHGLMHLMGYDHELGLPEAQKQLEAEIRLLDQIGVNPQIALCGRCSV